MEKLFCIRTFIGVCYVHIGMDRHVDSWVLNLGPWVMMVMSGGEEVVFSQGLCKYKSRALTTLRAAKLLIRRSCSSVLLLMPKRFRCVMEPCPESGVGAPALQEPHSLLDQAAVNPVQHQWGCRQLEFPRQRVQGR